MLCPKCGRGVEEDAVICGSCDFILDASFLGDDIMDEDRATRPGKGGVRVKDDFGDALILGDGGGKLESFDAGETALVHKETTQARFYVSGASQALLSPDAIPALVPNVEPSSLRLTPFERHLLQFVDGKSPVDRLRRKSGMEDLDVKTTLATLADKGIIVMAGRALADAPPPGARRSKPPASRTIRDEVSGRRAVIKDKPPKERSKVGKAPQPPAQAAPPPPPPPPPARRKKPGAPPAPSFEDTSTVIPAGDRPPVPPLAAGAALPRPSLDPPAEAEEAPPQRPEATRFHYDPKLVAKSVERTVAVNVADLEREHLRRKATPEPPAPAGRKPSAPPKPPPLPRDAWAPTDKVGDAAEEARARVAGELEEGDAGAGDAGLLPSGIRTQDHPGPPPDLEPVMVAPGAVTAELQRGDLADAQAAAGAQAEEEEEAPPPAQDEAAGEEAPQQEPPSDGDAAAAQDEAQAAGDDGEPQGEQDAGPEEAPQEDAADLAGLAPEEGPEDAGQEAGQEEAGQQAAGQEEAGQEEAGQEEAGQEDAGEEPPAGEDREEPAPDMAASDGGAEDAGEAPPAGDEEELADEEAAAGFEEAPPPPPELPPIAAVPLDRQPTRSAAAVLVDEPPVPLERAPTRAAAAVLVDEAPQPVARHLKEPSLEDLPLDAIQDVPPPPPPPAPVSQEPPAFLALDGGRPPPSLAGGNTVPPVAARAAVAPVEEDPSRPSHEKRYKAKKIFEQALKDVASGNMSSARMNAKLAAIYDPSEARYRDALAEWDRLSSSDRGGSGGKPREVELFEKAQDAEAKGDFKEAVRLLEEAIKAKPDAAGLYNRLGVVLATRLKEFARATSALQKAIDLDADNPTFKNNLGKVLAWEQAAEEESPKKKKKGLFGGNKKDDGEVVIRPRKYRPKEF